MSDVPNISPDQACHDLQLENVDAALIEILARRDVVVFSSLVRVGLELIRDPSLARETSPNVINLSNNAVNLIRDYCIEFPSILPLIKAGQYSLKGHVIFCSDNALIAAITKWRFEHLPPSIILRIQSPPSTPVTLNKSAPSSVAPSNTNTRTNSTSNQRKNNNKNNVPVISPADSNQNSKPPRQPKKKPQTQQSTESHTTANENAIDLSDSTAASNVWFQKTIESVKKPTPTKSPPKLSINPKQAPGSQSNAKGTNDSTATALTTNSAAKDNIAPTETATVTPVKETPPSIRYADVIKAPPPKKSVPPPAPAPKATAKLAATSTAAPAKAQAKRPKKREPIMLGDILIKEQEARKQPHAKKSVALPRPKPQPVAIAMNTASGAVIVKRGKVRETPKPKKLSRLKKLILMERAEKWKTRAKPVTDATPSDTDNKLAGDKSNGDENKSNAEDGLNSDEEPSDEEIEQVASKTNNNINLNNAAEPIKQKLTKVKKVPNKFLIREYCDQIITDELNAKLYALLAKLKELQTKMQQRDAKKAAMKKRFIVGLREVARSVKVSQVKLVILAPDIEESGAPDSLDDRVADILESARESSVLCVFGLNRKKIGEALGKKLRMSAVGLAYIDGANDLYNAVVEYAVKSRILFAMQRKVLQIQNDALGTETLTPKFEANTTKSDQGLLKPKSKILFPAAKYKNEEQLPDYQKFTTDKLIELLREHDDPRVKQKKNDKWTLFIQDIKTNKIFLFDNILPTTKLADIKSDLLLRTATSKKLISTLQLKFHDLALSADLDDLPICTLTGLENYSTITLQKITKEESKDV